MAKEKNKTELPTVMEGELKTRLIKLREDAGLDVAQMANALCLSEDVIVNLENEAFDLLAEPPYVRGYLRNYAKMGEDDPEELISRYESLRGADASELDFHMKSSSPIKMKQKKRISPIWGQVILLGVLIGGIALVASIPGVKSWMGNTWKSFSSQLQPSDASNNPSLLGELPIPVPLPEDEETVSTAENLAANPEVSKNTALYEETTEKTTTDKVTDKAFDSVVASNDTDKMAKAKSTTEDTATEEKIIEKSAAVTQETPTVTNTNGVINIDLTFNKEVWLRIKDKDNKTVFEGLNKAGSDKTLSLEKPLTFRVGNAQGLSMSIDDKAVDISTYINGSIANFTLE